nr:MAG TPA: hypothetical protein [Caudoviricetes sp.]
MGLWRNPVWVIGGYMELLNVHLNNFELLELMFWGETTIYWKDRIKATLLAGIFCEKEDGFPSVCYEVRPDFGEPYLKCQRNPFGKPESRLVRCVCEDLWHEGYAYAKVISCVAQVRSPYDSPKYDAVYWKIRLKRCEYDEQS